MKNYAIILAAGLGKRFFGNSLPKIFHPINNKSMISYSVDIMLSTMDECIIVTNSEHFDKIHKTFPTCIILRNDIDARLESIRVAMDYLCDMNGVGNVVIHDAARPYLSKSNIFNLFNSLRYDLYAQYYFPITNGLAKFNLDGYEIVPRDEYIELVTPSMIDYRLFKDLFENHIQNKISCCEVVSILDKLKIRYNLLKGTHKELRKITTLDDIY